MVVLDASSVVTAWDDYPIDQFPPTWAWIEAMIAAGEWTIPESAFIEIGHVAPDCAAWLAQRGLQALPISNAIAQTAMAIKAGLGIVNDDYHADGVDESDILVIASGKVLGVPVVSDEARQKVLPVNPKKYKIPAVCSMPNVTVPCQNFRQYMKDSKKVFV